MARAALLLRTMRDKTLNKKEKTARIFQLLLKKMLHQTLLLKFFSTTQWKFAFIRKIKS